MSATDQRHVIDSQRTVAALNSSEIDIPPHAALEYIGSFFPDSLAANARPVIQVQRPTRNDAHKVCVNGPHVIKAGKTGQVTFDYPTYVMVDLSGIGENEAATDTWGTEENSFALKYGGLGFRQIGGQCAVVGSQAKMRVERAAAPLPVYSAAFRNSLSEVQPGDPVAPLADYYRDPASEGLPSGVFATATGLFTTLSGSYLFGFSASLYSNSAPRGAQLVLRLYIDEEPTQYSMIRVQDIERDEYGVNLLTTLENVATGGPIQVAAQSTLSIRSESLYPVVVTPVTFWAMLVMPHAVEEEEE